MSRRREDPTNEFLTQRRRRPLRGQLAAACAAGLALGSGWLAAGSARGAEPPGAGAAIEARDAQIAMVLKGARSGGADLAVRLVTALGAVQDATVTDPAGVELTADAGAVEGQRIRVALNGTGRTPGRLLLDLDIQGQAVSGTYTGVWIKVAVQGAVSGTATAGTGRIEAGLPAALEFVKASYFGTAANDNFEGAAVGPDGSLYLVGNAGSSVGNLPGNAVGSRFGGDLAEPLCGCGFVLKLSADASRVLGYAELGRGILHATAVAVTSNAVYVGGYASDGLEALLKERTGCLTAYPLRKEQQLLREGKMLEANGFAADKPDPVAGRPWLGRLGAPCVLRFSADLKTLENGTYLGGWQQVYDKNRNCGRDAAGNRRGPFQEYFWQPINVCVLKDGDVAVAHDGGYFRMLTDKDREAAAKLDTPEDKAKLLERLCFYDVADYVSRLSGDLTQRRWRTDIYTPPTDPQVAGTIKKGWALPHYSSPRTHRMRMDAGGNLWVAGWSASATSQEPWWSPFLWQLDPKTGQPTRKLYEYDPMSGGGNRMGGTVADTALLSVAVEDDGNLLTCLIADGGNCVMEWGPRGNEGKRMTGPVIGPGLGKSPAHFWGQAHRVDGRSFDGLGGAKTGPYAWTIDAAGLPDGHFLALGRWNAPLPWTRNAWWKNGAIPNPNAFLRVVGPDYNTVFWTAIPGVRPFELMPIGGDRYLVMGFAAAGAAPAKDGLVVGTPGGEDAWFGIVKWMGSGK